MPDDLQAQTPVPVPQDAVASQAAAGPTPVPVPQGAVPSLAQPKRLGVDPMISGNEAMLADVVTGGLATPVTSLLRGTTGLGEDVAKVFQGAGLPRSLADIPDWYHHLIGTAPDSKPWWDAIHTAVKNPTQENIVRAVPLIGGLSADMAKDVSEKDYAGAVHQLFGAGASMFGLSEVSPATKALKEHIVDAARKRAALPKLEGLADLSDSIPSSKTTPYTPKDANQALPHILEEHKAGPIQSVEQFRDAADTAIGKIEDKIDGYIKTVPNDPIKTDVMGDVQKILSANPRGQSFVNAGMRELEGLNLNKPRLAEADRIRRQLNMENKAVLKRNNYDIATARAVDPGFAAREAAAESLRNGIYDQLKLRGIEGVDELRQTEGSIIKLRNAAQAQVFNGEKIVSSTAKTGPVRQAAAGATKTTATMLGAGTGAVVGGTPGAIAGGAAGQVAGDVAAKVITPGGLTRDQLMARAFKKLAKAELPPPEFPKVNLRAVPEEKPPVGTQAELPLGPSTLFDETSPSVTGERPADTPTNPAGPEPLGPAAAQAVEPRPQGTTVTVPERQPARTLETDLIKRLGPMVPPKILKVLNDPLATAAEKQAARKALREVADALPPKAEGHVRFKASDGSVHDVPKEQLPAARKIDPKLQVIKD
jgi:hypothetical protein